MARELKLNLFAALSAKLQRLFFVPVLYKAIGSLGLLLSVWRTADMNLDAKLNQVKDFETFDFIIVGAGSAGCLVANRLSRNYNVLLLEAGGEPNPLQSIPAFGSFLYGYPEIDWNHRSVPQTGGSLLSINQIIDVRNVETFNPFLHHKIMSVIPGVNVSSVSAPQQASRSAGKGLGGSGSLNLMLYLRGNPRDYNNWANQLDDASWNYEEMVPFFKKHESFRERRANHPYHGYKGEMSIEIPDFTGIAEDFIQGGLELGYPEIDVNAPHTEGFFKLYHNIKRGLRHSPYNAFIQPIMYRKRLTIIKYAQVNKILFRENNREVYGVEYERHGRTYTALCKKEIIVSAGAITSPKLLMLSGIGSREHLEELGIPVRHDLPVGRNFQDHLAGFLGPFFINQPNTLQLERDVTAESFVNLFTLGKGVLTSSQVHASAVFSSTFAKRRGEGDWPDIQFLTYGFSVNRGFTDLLNRALNFKLDEVQQYYKNDLNKESFHIGISAARPYSKGYIKLGGRSPYDNLIIDPNHLNDPESIDVKVLVEGMKVAVNLVENTPRFRNLGGHFTNASLPGCEHLSFRSDDYWECYARRYSFTLHHPCCTNPMGKRGSKNSVVDPELRVHGVSNLGVIDTSVMPTIVVTNLQAGTLGIAEKGAHMILRYWDTQNKEKNRNNPDRVFRFSVSAK